MFPETVALFDLDYSTMLEHSLSGNANNAETPIASAREQA